MKCISVMTARRPTVESRTMKSVFGINVFAVYTVGLLCVSIIFVSTDAKTDTKCYGVPGIPCTTHKLSCNNDTVINISKAEFGYRSGCNAKRGLSSCQNTDCCKEKKNDCQESFTDEEFQIVRSNCTGKQECSVHGRQRVDTVNRVCNDSVVSAYSKIEYTCILSDDITITTDTVTTLPPETTTDAVSDTSSTSVSSSTVTPTTVVNGITDPLTDSTNTAIVGGVLGSLCIVLIIIIILLVIYIKRRPPNSMPISDTQPMYDGLEFQSIDENDGQSNYDMIESNVAHINPAFISEENVNTKTTDPTYENIDQKKRKKRKKKVTKSTVNNNISEQSPNYLDVSQSPAPIYMNT